MPLHTFFDKTFCINLASRPDRREAFETECRVHGIQDVELVPGFELRDADGNLYGNHGCTHAHRELLRRVAAGPWERVLVFEDDVQYLSSGLWSQISGADQSIFSAVAPNALHERFDYLAAYVPPVWDVLFLGGAYMEAPIARINKHVLRVDRMSSTASYGVTREFAARYTEHVDAWCGGRTDLSLDYYPGAADVVLAGVITGSPSIALCLSPRLFSQRFSKSDITGNVTTGLWAGTDSTHERMAVLDESVVEKQ